MSGEQFLNFIESRKVRIVWGERDTEARVSVWTGDGREEISGENLRECLTRLWERNLPSVEPAGGTPPPH
jgi:hypothetical protein